MKQVTKPSPTTFFICEYCGKESTSRRDIHKCEEAHMVAVCAHTKWEFNTHVDENHDGWNDIEIVKQCTHCNHSISRRLCDYLTTQDQFARIFAILSEKEKET